jgi:hypothetical protein
VKTLSYPFFLFGFFSVSPALPVMAQQTSPSVGQAITFRVAGSSISDANGASLGNIEAVSVDPQSGRILFAMVSQGFPANRTTVTPVPWSLLQYRTDARAAGGIPGTFQQFSLSVPQQVVRSAPQLDSQAMARAADTSWMTTTYNYFAPYSAAGTAGAASGVQTAAGNAVNNPNGSAVLPSANGFPLTNSLVPTNASARFTNQVFAPGTTNTPSILPAGALPPGTVPANGLPPGTLPADGTEPASQPPANPAQPRKVPLAPAVPRR